MIEAGSRRGSGGGVDSLCLTTLYGFHPAAHRRPRRLFTPVMASPSARRRHLATPNAYRKRTTTLCCSRHRRIERCLPCRRRIPKNARGARQRRAQAARDPGDIDYINLHGTAIPATIGRKVGPSPVFGPTTICSSTKGATGHTRRGRGVGGGHHAIALRHGLMPGGGTPMTSIPLSQRTTLELIALLLRRVLPIVRLCGTNCSLILAAPMKLAAYIGTRRARAGLATGLRPLPHGGRQVSPGLAVPLTPHFGGRSAGAPGRSSGWPWESRCKTAQAGEDPATWPGSLGATPELLRTPPRLVARKSRKSPTRFATRCTTRLRVLEHATGHGRIQCAGALTQLPRAS